MSFSTDKLLRLADKLGINFGVGPCIGFDTVLAIAYLGEISDQLFNLLDFIGNHTDMEALAHEIEAAKLKVGLLGFSKRDKQLLATYQLLVSIAAICEDQYQNSTILLQTYASKQLIFSGLLKEKLLRSAEEVFILEKNEITELFELLSPYFATYPSICLGIESPDHDVFLSYSRKEKLWQLSDINDFDGESEEGEYFYSYDNESLADALADCFNDDEICLMKIKLFYRADIDSRLINRLTATLTEYAAINSRRAQMANSDGLGLLHLEAQRGNLKRVTQLLELKTNPDQLSKTNNIGPIFVACENGHLHVVQKLLATTMININQLAKNGNSLLIAACSTKQWPIVDYLLSYTNIDVNLQNSLGLSALHFAVLSQNKKICQRLIQKGANIHAFSANFGTPLKFAELLENKALLATAPCTNEHATHSPSGRVTQDDPADLYPYRID
ncbi:ankyrin repeat protein [Legionella massiliensis]|uniref:Ankyrin repeat protein n=1 Tax=Legionella massiliensis TaxID=1034943 RepID=A0A078KXM0_9GAMM|nr:ankyrin repeat domain-containing protein [Legionella massiliensis]CDZ77777.1 ankyrin repeat protein [Legionella massiliensis]CEE13515.1 Ankyrin repeats (3 copies) [Legionella massiliensis]